MKPLHGYKCPECGGGILYDQNTDTYICEKCLEEYDCLAALDEEE
jgi:uncharacterized protein (DUF983 family)